MWKVERLSQKDQKEIIRLLQEDQIIKIIRLMNERKVSFRPISECCGREQFIKKLKNVIDQNYTKT